MSWGDSGYGGSVLGVELTSIVDISYSRSTCVAQKTDGTNVDRRDSSYGFDAPGVKLTNIVDISCCSRACVT